MVVGFTGTYRFVSAGFALLVRSNDLHKNDYALSHYKTATIKYNSAAYYLQFKYIRWRGFTDVNPTNSVSAGEGSTEKPNLASKEFQFEGLYNFNWKRYSYTAPVNFSQRQVKSHGGFLLKAGIYYHQLADKTSILSQKQISYFDDFSDVASIQSLSLKFAPGLGGNLVFLRRMYFSASAFSSFNLCFYSYKNSDSDNLTKQHAVVYSLDGKASIGYQSKRFYAGLLYEAEGRQAKLKNIQFGMAYSNLGFEIGYRFEAPNVMRKFYKATMPPGM